MQISAAVIIPLITFSSKCIMVYHSNVKHSTTLALVMRFQSANEACDLRTFCFISQGLPIPLGIHCMVAGPKWCSVHAVKYPICNCVHSYSISPCQTPFFKSMSFATISKPWMATELTKTMCTQVPGAHFRARVQGLDSGTSTVSPWVYLKKGCVHISTQRVPYSGTVSGHQV